MFYIGKNFEPMAQKVNTNKERKENELSEKKKNTPFMQVDKPSDLISNFITNFKRQSTEPESIIGATKTVMRSDFKNDRKSQTLQTNKKPALRIDNTIKPQPARPKNNKPKLGL